MVTSPRAAEGKLFRAQQFIHHIRRNDFGENGFDAALFPLLKNHAIGDEAQVLDQHRARDGKHQREPVTKFHEGIKSGGNIGQQQQQNRRRSHKGPHLPGEKRRQRAEKNNQRHFQRQRCAADELAGDDGVGDVPMFADEQRVLFQRRRAAVGQIVALRRRADDDQLAAKVIAQVRSSRPSNRCCPARANFQSARAETRIIWFVSRQSM
jgi:hypothetical protein